MDSVLKKVLWFGGAYAFIAVAATGYILLTGSLSGRRGERDEATVARGGALYAEHCARCHGAALEGQKGWETRRPDGTIPAPPLNGGGHAWQHADRQLFDIVKLGGGLFSRRGERSEMPAFGDDMSDGDIWAVIAYVKSRWPEETRAKQIRTNLLGSFEHH